MPHVILKMVEGRTEEQKKALSDALTLAVTTTLGCGEDLVSVAIEDVKDEEWMAKVYVPDIQRQPDRIYRMPGYGPED
ncbi:MULTISPECIES: tautomerase family protein [unclassified Shinella]|uniref:tautomerase family protein n=1 Tax=unclassified Shinella TaxID=2643062 RepID=UPI00234EE437|nr:MULTISPECIES: tautomerase family protein [unclassified Shinella]MDC7262484.1 tautomerase family protein [Shinella sp. HY16]MDC7269379.1 tautomerase family protein [Shinella sp. YZ44]